MKRTMYEAARHTPKRKAARSSRAGDTTPKWILSHSESPVTDRAFSVGSVSSCLYREEKCSIIIKKLS